MHRRDQEQSADQPREIRLLPADKVAGRPVSLGRVVVHARRGLDPMARPLVEAADAISGGRILAVTHPDPSAALALAALRPGARVEFFHLDLYHAARCSRMAAANKLRNVETACAPNLPPGEGRDLALLMVRRDGEAALNLELARQAHGALAPGGKLLASINNPRDQWLRRQLERIFGNLSLAARDKTGLVYLCKRGPGPAAPPEQLQFIQAHRVRAGGIELELDSCYGVFSPNGLDEGSRALLEVMEPVPAGGAIFNPGCNWGAMGILAARRDGAGRLLLIDSSSRAVQMARRNTERHMPSAETRHEYQGEHFLLDSEWGAFDAVVTNPPYATEFAVMAMFARVGHRALRRGGRLWMVGKRNERMVELAGEVFGNVAPIARRGYLVASAVKK